MSLFLAYAIVGVGEASVIAAVSTGVLRGRSSNSAEVTDPDRDEEPERARAGLFLMMGAFLVMGLLGAWVGLIVTSGSPDSDRVAGALFGWAAGKVVCWLAMLGVIVARAWRDTVRRMS